MPTSSDLHPLLARQLSKLRLAPGQAPDAEAFDLLLQRVNRAYVESEQERYLLERSQDIASREMVTLNRDLHSSQARLASLLSLSTDWVWEQDAEGRFTYVSDELQQGIGLDGKLLLGQCCGADTPLRTSAEDDALLKAHRAARESFLDVTFEVVGPDGQCHYMRISGEPVLEGEHFGGYRGVGSDVTAAVEADRRVQELARRKLEAQLDFSSRLIEVSPTPLFVKNEQGRFVTVNRAWLDLMSLTNEQVIGKTSVDLYGDEAETHMRHDEQLLHTEGMVRYENRLVRPDGEVRDTVVTKLRFTQADGSPAGIIGSIIDVTEFREAERATSMARDAAEAADRAKSEFIANISHELRTPLQAIIGFSELGVARAKEPRWQEMFRDIHDGGHRMLTLVNALLDVSKIGDSTGPITRHRRDLFVLAREVVKELQPLVAKRDLRVVLPDPAASLMADVDSFRIQQVIRNVLANALRFAPPGTSIDIEGCDLGEDGVEVSVRDHGPGIPPDELEAIFDPFVQSSRTGDGSGGTGLGLTICRKIMAAHGGHIVASNAADGGARMSLRLPACLRSRSEAAA